MDSPAITIRRAGPRDAAAFVRIMGDMQVLPSLMQVPYQSEERWQALLAEAAAAGKRDIVLVAERSVDRGMRVVGTAGLHPDGSGLRRHHVMHLGLTVAPEAQRQGVGRALMQALCDYADRWAQVLRIELAVYTDNEAAIGLYRQFGFEHEGTFRAYALRDGRYVDAYAMARLHPDPPRWA